jgi:hypothetical protein
MWTRLDRLHMLCEHGDILQYLSHHVLYHNVYTDIVFFTLRIRDNDL